MEKRALIPYRTIAGNDTLASISICVVIGHKGQLGYTGEF
jgi:hypothetical protein